MEKMGGHGAKTGSQPNQFGLAESGCTISHQSSFFTLSDLPSIQRPSTLYTAEKQNSEKGKRQREENNHGGKDAP